MIFWFFGYPGIGKDYCARRLSEITDCFYVHADAYLTISEKEKLQLGTFTREDRHKKLERICDNLLRLLTMHPAITIGDSLPDEKSRLYVQQTLGANLCLVRVVADVSTHKRRITERGNHFFTPDLLDDWIEKHWEEPQDRYITFDTTHGLLSDLDEQLETLYQSSF